MRSKGIVREHKIVNVCSLGGWRLFEVPGNFNEPWKREKHKGTQLDTHQIALNRDEAWGGSQRLPVFFLHTPLVL